MKCIYICNMSNLTQLIYQKNIHARLENMYKMQCCKKKGQERNMIGFDWQITMIGPCVGI